MKQLTKWMAGLLLALLIYKPLLAEEDIAGVVLTFDDTYVDQWHDFFGKRTDGVKATFFLSYWHTLSAEQKAKLASLQMMGHEIGHHTYSHKGVAGDYNFDPNRVQEYLDEQIIPQLDAMRADGFDPQSFSYPSGERDLVYDAALHQYFPYLRTTFADETKQLFEMDDIFHSADKSYSVLAGDGIDNSYGNEIAEIEAALLRAKTNNEVLTLYAHRILPDDSADADHNYGVRVSKLNQVITAAQQMGLKFYTFAEAYQLGNQVAPVVPNNVQTVVEGDRVRVIWTDVANNFIGIVPVGQPAWTPDMPGAYSDGSADGKLGITIPVTEQDQHYVAMLYLDADIVATSDPFTIAGTGDTGTGGTGGTGTGTGGTGTGTGGTGTGTGGTGTGTGGPDTSTLCTTTGDCTVSTALEGNRVRIVWKRVLNNFIGIVPVGQDGWQIGMAGADTPGKASGKIGITVPALEQDQQYVAMFYLDAALVAVSEPFTIAGTNPGGTGTGTEGSGTGTEGSGTGTEGSGTGTEGSGTGTEGSGTGTDGGSTGSGSTTGTIEVGIEGSRVRLTWQDVTADFIGIVPADQSVWQEGMSGAWTNGGSSGKMGITVNEAVPGQLYQAIFYLNNVYVAGSATFSIN